MTGTTRRPGTTQHYTHCVRYCTDNGGEECTIAHECWCTDNGLTYVEFTALHPDHDPSQAQEDELL